MKKNEQSFSDWNGEELKKHRKSINLNQIAMSKKLGMSERGYRCYETDQYRIPLSVKYAVLYLCKEKNVKKGTDDIKNFDDNKIPLTKFEKERIWKLCNAIDNTLIEAKKRKDEIWVSRLLDQSNREMTMLLQKAS
jgi:predicted transcriptional regulator|tara:strand:+ start:36 stop:443 length:408 start_codon:yes stop_codon:yes gene_type:complete